MSGSLLLDSAAGNNAAYSLSGGGQLSANIEYVGEFGKGTFAHSGGTNTVGDYLYLGYLAGSSGTYSLSGGQLSAPGEYLGYYGAGTFSQSGGTNFPGALYLGGFAGSGGTYSLSGSGQLSAPPSTWAIRHGDLHAVRRDQQYQPASSCSATTPAAAPTTSAAAASCRRPPRYVGYSGAGTFTQSGGTNSIQNNLALSANAGGSGTYNLSGSGQLSASYEYVGCSGTGTFTQSGGTNSIGSYLYLGNVRQQRHVQP